MLTPQVIVNASPYLTFGQLASSSAILEAFVGESHVHVIDFGMGFGIQWQAFIQALAARAGGPPHLRITGVDICSPNKFKRAHCLVETGRRLTVSRLPLRSPSCRRQRGRGGQRGRAGGQGNMEEGDSEGADRGVVEWAVEIRTHALISNFTNFDKFQIEIQSD